MNKNWRWLNLFFVVLNTVVGSSCLVDGRYLLAGLNFFAVYLNYRSFEHLSSTTSKGRV